MIAFILTLKMLATLMTLLCTAATIAFYRAAAREAGQAMPLAAILFWPSLGLTLILWLLTDYMWIN